MQQLRYYIFVDFTTFLKQHAYPPLIGVATDGKYLYHQYNFVKEQDLYLLFGSESRGLPGEIISLCQQQTVRIPMKNNIDSLNLALSVGIIGYEVWRQ